MELLLDKSVYPAITTNIIPSRYAASMIPGHEVKVDEGSFGILISQWLERQDHTTYVYHLHLEQPVRLYIPVPKPFSTLYIAIENSPTLLFMKSIFGSRRIKEGRSMFLRFSRNDILHEIRFKKGDHKSLHFTRHNDNGFYYRNDLLYESWVDEYKAFLRKWK